MLKRKYSRQVITNGKKTFNIASKSSFNVSDQTSKVNGNRAVIDGSSGGIRLDTNAEDERLRSDERARRLEHVRMEGIGEARLEGQRRRQMDLEQIQQQRLQIESRARMEAERKNLEVKKYETVNSARINSDYNYVPPKTVLDSKSIGPLLEQIDGPLMYDYESKESTYTGRSTKIYGGSTLDIPIRVSAPGSIVEYTIEKKSYDFGLGITAKLDQGGATVVKPMARFDGNDVVADRPRQKNANRSGFGWCGKRSVYT